MRRARCHGGPRRRRRTPPRTGRPRRRAPARPCATARSRPRAPRARSAPGSMQASRRSGGRPRRMVKTAVRPTNPWRETTIDRRAPARSERSKRRTCSGPRRRGGGPYAAGTGHRGTRRDERAARRDDDKAADAGAGGGHRPGDLDPHAGSTCSAFDPCADEPDVPFPPALPALAAEPVADDPPGTVTVSSANAVAPPLSVTRRPTSCVPGPNVALAAGPLASPYVAVAVEVPVERHDVLRPVRVRRGRGEVHHRSGRRAPRREREPCDGRPVDAEGDRRDVRRAVAVGDPQVHRLLAGGRIRRDRGGPGRVAEGAVPVEVPGVRRDRALGIARRRARERDLLARERDVERLPGRGFTVEKTIRAVGGAFTGPTRWRSSAGPRCSSRSS